MRLKKFNGFDKNGYLPPGAYNMTLNEVEELFSKNKTMVVSLYKSTGGFHLAKYATSAEK